MSPHYAGLFFSIGNTVGNISGVIAPIVAGQILQVQYYDATANCFQNAFKVLSINANHGQACHPMNWAIIHPMNGAIISSHELGHYFIP
jgi:hypothetical protein